MKKHNNIAKLLTISRIREVYSAIEEFLKKHGKDVSKEYWIESFVWAHQSDALLLLHNLDCLASVSSSKIGKVR